VVIRLDANPTTLYDLHSNIVPPGSLLPNKLPLYPAPNPTPITPRLDVDTTDSLTREKKGKMPALSHLLSVGKGRVLALAADEKYVYAGCQSAENEIVVS
jgi:di- and tripeptidase